MATSCKQAEDPQETHRWGRRCTRRSRACCCRSPQGTSYTAQHTGQKGGRCWLCVRANTTAMNAVLQQIKQLWLLLLIVAARGMHNCLCRPLILRHCTCCHPHAANPIFSPQLCSERTQWSRQDSHGSTHLRGHTTTQKSGVQSQCGPVRPGAHCLGLK
jgi:hypothetical protein